MEKQVIKCEICNHYKMYVYINKYGICAITCTNCGVTRGGGAKIQTDTDIIEERLKSLPNIDSRHIVL